MNNRTPVFSCEFFPPRTPAGEEKLLLTRKALDEVIHPAYYSVTFGAGGATRDRTLETVQRLRADNVEIAPHISCIGSSKAQISELLQAYRQLGVNRLVALRGDIPASGESTGELTHANELVTYIRETTGDHFEIEVAAYPEYHPEADSPQSDFRYFKQKVEAGANGAITQYFYNIDAYRCFMDRCEKAGIDIPVTPGIMPITGFENLVRFSDICGAEIPRWIRRQLEAYAGDRDSLLDFGLDVVSQLCERLLAEGAPGLHFYTLNQAEASNRIWKRLGV